MLTNRFVKIAYNDLKRLNEQQIPQSIKGNVKRSNFFETGSTIKKFEWIRYEKFINLLMRWTTVVCTIFWNFWIKSL